MFILPSKVSHYVCLIFLIYLEKSKNEHYRSAVHKVSFVFVIANGSTNSKPSSNMAHLMAIASLTRSLSARSRSFIFPSFPGHYSIGKSVASASMQFSCLAWFR